RPLRRACRDCDRSRWARRRRNSRRASKSRPAAYAANLARPRNSHRPESLFQSVHSCACSFFVCFIVFGAFEQFAVRAVAFAFQFVERDKTQRRGIDAIAQTAIFPRTIRKHMAQMAVTVAGTNFGATHAV